jgi:uncharacterized membrane protein
MLPDILGYNIDEGLVLLGKCGINNSSIIIHEYLSPKSDIVGNERRILKTSEDAGKIIIVVSYF